jgi:redox-sensitive bicupin YhaK (pirin superfamily)
MHHDDHYPAGNERMGPDASLAGRNIGQDFSGKDGWSMYHGQQVPGFPRHPHRGFETITIARNGFIDHSDSLGAAARFGQGDVQWMTAGKGVVHSEMFPLLNRDEPNHVELFQIWLNLPREDKTKDAYFTMFWHETIPHDTVRDADGRATEISVVAGPLAEMTPATPPPSSWAARPDSDIAVWTLKMEPGARWSAPAAGPESNRMVYFFAGETCEIGGQRVERGHAVQVRADAECPIENGDAPAEFLILQGRPIGEPVVQYGPYVMNTQGEIRQTMIDYQRTGFGGWPWESDAPAHPRDKGRFALHADGREETPNP